MKTTVSISEARADLAGIVRSLSDDPHAAVGITVNGRLEAVVTGPAGGQGDTPAGWIYAGRHPADHLPEEIRAVIPTDMRHDLASTVWIHAASGAVVLLTASGHWDSRGEPLARYFSPSRDLIMPLHLDVPDWKGDSPAAYHAAMAEARRYVARLIAS